MSTPFANEELSALLDGELSDIEAAALEARLDADPVLRAELLELEQASLFLRTHGPARAPADFEERLLALVASEPLPANSTWWRRPFGVPIEGFAVAAIALLALGVSLTPAMMQGGASQKSAADHAAGRLEPSDKRASGATARSDVAGAAAARSDVAGAAAARSDAAGAAASPDAAAPQQPAEAPAVDSSVASAPARPVTSAAPAERKSSKGADAPPPAKVTTIKGARSKHEEPYEPAAAQQPSEPAPAEQQVAATQQATAAAPSPKPLSSAVYRYVLTTDDPDALAALQRLASRYKGNVARSTTRGGGDGSYMVKLPATALTEFGDALRSLGQVQEQPDDRWYGDTNPTVQVDIRYVPAAGGSAPMMDKASSASEP